MQREDTAVARSHGLLPSKQAAAGRELRNQWKRQEELLRAERDEAREEAEAEQRRRVEAEQAAAEREKRLAESVAEQRRRRGEAEAALKRLEGALEESEAYRKRMREREGEQWRAGRSSRAADVHGRESDLANAQAVIASLERERDGAYRKGVAAFVRAFNALLVRHGLGESVQAQPLVLKALREGEKGRVPGEAQEQGTRQVEAGREVL